MTIIQLLRTILFPRCTELEAMNIQLRIDNNILRNSLDKFIQIPQQTNSARIGKDGLKKVLTETFGDTWIDVFNQGDDSFKLVHLEYFKTFLAGNRVNNLLYLPRDRDCEDFSDMLMGDTAHFDSDLAFGTIWVLKETGKAHALNWLIDTESTIWMCEPQSDALFRYPNGWVIYDHLKM